MMNSQPTTLNAVPVFPLPDYFLFPGVVAPLHVFETRYRQMVDDLMDGPGRLVMASFRPDGPRDDQGPVLLPVGTLAEIVQHEKLTDGSCALVVAALGRVSLHEVDSVRLYRKVDAEVIEEPVPNPEAAAALGERVIAALKERAAGTWDAPRDTPVGRLADLLLHTLQLDTDRQARAYIETDPLGRAAMALMWHEEKDEASEEA